ncbi:hypothetical protein PMAC_002404 [Pneumocystis sp. 'macacae']|nr:hypothetical protein PMAC_002404 [Pneumocystis sp. 'macacae']
MSGPQCARSAGSEWSGAALEEAHVHGAYEAIAAGFSATRRRVGLERRAVLMGQPWPSVVDFLMAQPQGSVGLDVGCGNGRHLSVRPDIVLVGLDSGRAVGGWCGVVARVSVAGERREAYTRRCEALVRQAARRGDTDVLVGDGLSMPMRPIFDFCLSIAVIHHFATERRRIAALQALLGVLRPGGRAYVVVWALEQPDSRRGWDAGDEQDVLVPWKRSDGAGGSSVHAERDVSAQPGARLSQAVSSAIIGGHRWSGLEIRKKQQAGAEQGCIGSTEMPAGNFCLINRTTYTEITIENEQIESRQLPGWTAVSDRMLRGCLKDMLQRVS